MINIFMMPIGVVGDIIRLTYQLKSLIRHNSVLCYILWVIFQSGESVRGYNPHSQTEFTKYQVEWDSSMAYRSLDHFSSLGHLIPDLVLNF